MNEPGLQVWELTYAREPSGKKAMLFGSIGEPLASAAGNVIVFVTACVAMLITVTVPEVLPLPLLATRTWVPSGVGAAFTGLVPTGTVAVLAGGQVLKKPTVFVFGPGMIN